MTTDNKNYYWEKRKDSMYLYAAQQVCSKYGGKAVSVLDVGSNRTPTLEWHRKNAQCLVSLDLRNPYVAPGVESIQANFFDFTAEQKFDLVTCFQVLEHVPDAGAFAKKLLEVGKVIVASVPYKWPEGKSKFHIHDPVDEQKMLDWFGRAPVYSYIAREVMDKKERMINVYFTDPELIAKHKAKERAAAASKTKAPSKRPWYAGIRLPFFSSKKKA